MKTLKEQYEQLVEVKKPWKYNETYSQKDMKVFAKHMKKAQKAASNLYDALVEIDFEIAYDVIQSDMNLTEKEFDKILDIIERFGRSTEGVEVAELYARDIEFKNGITITEFGPKATSSVENK